MRLTKITKTNEKSLAHIKPKRVIYGGVLYHGRGFLLDRPLFGNSPNSFAKNHKNTANVWTREKYAAAHRDREKRQRGRILFSSNEETLIRSTIEESIFDVGIFPVEVVVETPDGKSERYLVEY